MPARLQTCKADYLFGTVLPASGNNERVNAGKAVGCIAAKPKQCDKKKNSERTENVTPVLSPPLFLVADAACGCRCAGIQPSDSTPCGTLRARVPAALRAPCTELPEASAERFRECMLPYSGSLLLPLFLFFVFSI